MVDIDRSSRARGLGAGVPVVAWTYAYERTRNLAVSAVTHAMTCTITPHEVVSQVLPS